MKLPTDLDDLLRQNTATHACVLSSIANFEAWIENSTLPFFPEYTLHDIGHIEEVIWTANDLITEEAKPLISPLDVAVLVLAALLHDCAMHITEEGFQTLIDSNTQWAPLDHFDRRSWPNLWEDFLADASRFDGRTLTELFGEPEPIQRPPENIKDYKPRDRLLIGEFVRRNHTRLAHEIALHGLPGPNGVSTHLIDPSNSYLPDLAGAVARSHGHDLRKLLPYLETKFHVRDFNGCHAVYLAVLLRVADHLQIQPTRAPKMVLKIRRLQSPLSNAEWKVHHSIQNITTADHDPEALQIFAHPTDTKTYLKLVEWQTSLQNELDRSWAILGEVFGRYKKEHFERFGLTIRRVRSNLDDVEKFSSEVNYIPGQIAFDAANPDLLKLLVNPLYGHRPEIGVRELIQNAVDEVRERDDFLRSRKQSTEKRIFDIEIYFIYKNGIPTDFKIIDFGIGMNEYIVRNYFLKAGASFRKSDAWKKEFEDAQGQSKIARSGRFGVGALAAFLLGDSVKVTTRHFDSPNTHGLQFSADLDSRELDVHRTDCPIGTTIEIKINEESRRPFLELLTSATRHHGKSDLRKFNWYFLKYPTISFKLMNDSEIIEISSDTDLPNASDGFVKPWRVVSTKKYEKVHWSNRGKILYCNGLRIGDESGSSIAQFSDDLKLLPGDFDLNMPSLSVFDYNGKLPLNLQRDRLVTENIDFEDNLVESILDDFISFLIKKGPDGVLTRVPPPENMSVSHSLVREKGVRSNWRERRRCFWVFLREGYTFGGRQTIARIGPRYILILPCLFDTHKLLSNLPRNEFPNKEMTLPSNSIAVGFDIGGHQYREQAPMAEFCIGKMHQTYGSDFVERKWGLNLEGKAVWMSEEAETRFNYLRGGRQFVSQYMEKFERVELGGGFVRYTYLCDEPQVDFDPCQWLSCLRQIGCPTDQLAIGTWICGEMAPREKVEAFYSWEKGNDRMHLYDILFDKLGCCVFPYSVSERQSLFSEVIERCTSYLQMY